MLVAMPEFKTSPLEIERAMIYEDFADFTEAVTVTTPEWVWEAPPGALPDSAELLGVTEHSRHYGNEVRPAGTPARVRLNDYQSKTPWLDATVLDGVNGWFNLNGYRVQVAKDDDVMYPTAGSGLERVTFRLASSGAARLRYRALSVKWRVQYSLDLEQGTLAAQAVITSAEAVRLQDVTLISGDVRLNERDEDEFERVRRRKLVYAMRSDDPGVSEGVFVYPLPNALELQPGVTIVPLWVGALEIEREVTVHAHSTGEGAAFRAYLFTAPVPLAPGVIGVRERVFLGESTLQATLKGDQARVMPLGQDFEVMVVARVLERKAKLERRVIEFHNQKDSPVRLRLEWRAGHRMTWNKWPEDAQLEGENLLLERTVGAGERASIEATAQSDKA
jgi:hypothetical protein